VSGIACFTPYKKGCPLPFVIPLNLFQTTLTNFASTRIRLQPLPVFISHLNTAAPATLAQQPFTASVGGCFTAFSLMCLLPHPPPSPAVSESALAAMPFTAS